MKLLVFCVLQPMLIQFSMATDSIPTLAIPGTVLGPTSKYAPGPGTHIYGGNVVSSLLGNVSVTAPAKAPGPVKRLNKLTAPTAEERSTISVVRRGRKREVLPDVGNIVLARVLRLMPKQAIVVIQQVGSTVLQTEWQGVIRVQDVRATEQDKVKIHESFKPGDIVRAQVVSQPISLWNTVKRLRLQGLTQGTIRSPWATKPTTTFQRQQTSSVSSWPPAILAMTWFPLAGRSSGIPRRG